MIGNIRPKPKIFEKRGARIKFAKLYVLGTGSSAWKCVTLGHAIETFLGRLTHEKRRSQLFSS